MDDQVQPLAGETTALVHSYDLDGGFGRGGIDVVDAPLYWRFKGGRVVCWSLEQLVRKTKFDTTDLRAHQAASTARTPDEGRGPKLQSELHGKNPDGFAVWGITRASD